MSAAANRDNAIAALRAEENWLAEHGGTLEAYVANYGSAKDPVHYGNGGEAIFEADLTAVHKAEERAVEAILKAGGLS